LLFLRYKLLGIVGFIGDKITDVKRIIGHYTAYCKRRINQWEGHDDLQKKQ